MIDNYIKIPLTVLEDNNLCSSSKLLFGYILLLAHKQGYCYASNEYLGKELKTSKRNISRLLNKLKINNYITLQYNRRYQRKIFIPEVKFISSSIEESF